MTHMEEVTRQQTKDIKLLGTFVEAYCTGKHSRGDQSIVALPAEMGNRSLCQECASFLEYAITKRLQCPLEADKPTCKNCRIHCYDTLRREKVRAIMSYAGRRLMMRGRLDYLWHYFF